MPSGKDPKPMPDKNRDKKPNMTTPPKDRDVKGMVNKDKRTPPSGSSGSRKR